jgi:hypothetical protein
MKRVGPASSPDQRLAITETAQCADTNATQNAKKVRNVLMNREASRVMMRTSIAERVGDPPP